MEILTQLHFSVGFASYFHVVLVWAFLHRAESASWEERREVVWFWGLDPPFSFRLGVRAETSHAESEIIQGGGAPCCFFCTSSMECDWALKSPLQLGAACTQVYRVCGLIINWLSCLSLLWRPPSASSHFPLSSSRPAQLGGRIMTLLSASCSWFSKDIGPLRRLIC